MKKLTCKILSDNGQEAFSYECDVTDEKCADLISILGPIFNNFRNIEGESNDSPGQA